MNKQQIGSIKEGMASRQAKYRAWWVHEKYNPEGSMFHVGAIHFATPQDGEPEADLTDEIYEIGLMGSKANYKIGFNSAKECVLMQFTGLKDKDGKEIYEGDIVEFEGDYCFEKFLGKRIGYVYFNSDLLQYKINTDKGGMAFREWKDDGPEVIGNVFQDSELLTKSKT